MSSVPKRIKALKRIKTPAFGQHVISQSLVFLCFPDEMRDPEAQRPPQTVNGPPNSSSTVNTGGFASALTPIFTCCYSQAASSHTAKFRRLAGTRSIAAAAAVVVFAYFTFLLSFSPV